MSEKKETIFIEGIRFFKPRENAPSWIKGNVVITLSELREFIKKNDIKDQMRIDLCKSDKKGTYYFTLNNWKPAEKPKQKDISVPMVEGMEYPEEDISPEDIPF